MPQPSLASDTDADGGGVAYMPWRLPDELLFSWLSRAHAHHGSPSPKAFAAALFGRPLAIGFEAPCHLDRLASRLPTRNVIDGPRLAHDMTLFPFYAAFMEPDHRPAILEAMCRGGGNRARAMLGLSNASGRPPALRFCPECRDEDISEHGETYWRRRFQVGSSLVCRVHMRPLQWSDQPAPSGILFGAATPINCPDDARPVADVPDARAMERLAELALEGERLLAGAPQLRSRSELSREYREALSDVGIARGPGDKYGTDLVAAIRDHWGCALTCLGAEGEVSEKRPWPRRLLAGDDACSPVRHLLIRGFLHAANDDRYRRDRPFGDGPWRCENPLADHHGELTIDRCHISRRNMLWQDTGTFACVCGFVYRRRLQHDGSTRRLPVVVWGPLLDLYLTRCVAEGIDLRVAATKLRRSEQTVRVWARERGIRLPPPSPHVSTGVDWARLDSEMAPRVLAAAAEIRALDPPVWVNQARLAVVAGKSVKTIRSNLYRMPRMAAVWDAVVEDDDAWNARRIDYAVRCLGSRGSSLSPKERARLRAIRGVQQRVALDGMPMIEGKL
ncbi:MAG: TnsD family Tn7-like transposition protein [Pseudomonadota bacterium]